MRRAKKSLESCGHIEKVREPILEIGTWGVSGSSRVFMFEEYVLESSV